MPPPSAGEMQHRPAGEHRQGLVPGIRRHIRAEHQRMEAERPKMAAVRVIHQKRDAPAVAEGRHPSNIGQPPGVIRACYVNRVRVTG